MEIQYILNQLINYILANKYDKAAILYLINSKEESWGQSGTFFRGLHFPEPVDRYEVIESDIQSFTDDIDIAVDFSNKGRYSVVVVKKCKWCFSVTKFLKWATEQGYDTTRVKNITEREKEFLTDIKRHEVTLLEPF